MTEPALELRGVTVRFEAQGPASIANVSLALEPGERVALVGLNGSGKTTLLRTVVGLVEYEGEILVGGSVLSHRTLGAVRSNVGFLFNVPEDQLLFPRVIDDAAFALVRKGVSAPEAAKRAREVLDRLGVGHLADSPLHHLSHGQKQRVALAGALVSSPPLLLLDEPSAALDPPGKRDLLKLLLGQDAAILVATHDLEFTTGLCTRYVLLEEGKVAFDGADEQEVRRRL